MAKMASWEAGMTGQKRRNLDDYIGIAGGGGDKRIPKAPFDPRAIFLVQLYIISERE